MVKYAGRAAIAGILSTGIAIGVAPSAFAQEDTTPVVSETTTTEAPGTDAPVALDSLYANDVFIFDTKTTEDGKFEFTNYRVHADKKVAEEKGITTYTLSRGYTVHGSDNQETDITKKVAIDRTNGDIQFMANTVDDEPNALVAEVVGTNEAGEKFIDVITLTNQKVVSGLDDGGDETPVDNTNPAGSSSGILAALLALLGLGNAGSSTGADTGETSRYADRVEDKLKELGLWDIYQNNKDKRDGSGSEALVKALEKWQDKDADADKDGNASTTTTPAPSESPSTTVTETVTVNPDKGEDTATTANQEPTDVLQAAPVNNEQGSNTANTAPTPQARDSKTAPTTTAAAAPVAQSATPTSTAPVSSVSTGGSIAQSPAKWLVAFAASIAAAAGAVLFGRRKISE